MGCIKIVSLLLVCMLVAAPVTTDAAITCGTVASLLQPCISYLQGRGPLPPACCNGVKSLNAKATTTPDRQAACNCLKAASQGVNGGLAAGLPGKCGVNIPYKISPSIDCSKIR
ncbi:nonspecific lipid transfer protein [Tripterygium wilfordii]|uniref:Non-specific lipid-transfer protein n=1 Tax=Tripterygium wilfordii TaxID=458696 RepID=A0A7J7DWR9_TRIWF|nr:non-specific lipid-transfer protein 1-like [Tripterygium wilfordii]KAF5750741.1 nonspecific lipid transfer protein [Tripterygium wilfordii]